ncbi:MBL fold metallo-hydrolase [Crossiella sp. NPDC003009]
MKIHHLNCGSMHMRTPLVCHVLLLETTNGLVLVDTGFGLKDIEDPAGRIGFTRHLTKPALDPAETAVHQFRALGHAPEDVQHILLTHLDFDHAGGLADFPNAQVHTTAAEWQAARHPSTAKERRRYHSTHWSHGPKITAHEPTGDSWFGFPAATPLDHIAPGLILIPLPGHTRGHAGYAINRGDTWLFHAGDAFFHHSALTDKGWRPTLHRLQETLLAVDRKRLHHNRSRLAELRTNPTVEVVSAHDPVLLAKAQSAP